MPNSQLSQATGMPVCEDRRISEGRDTLRDLLGVPLGYTDGGLTGGSYSRSPVTEGRGTISKSSSSGFRISVLAR
jgi:hypothetical protein